MLLTHVNQLQNNCRGQDVLILNTGFGNGEDQKRVTELLHVETPTAPDDSG